MNIVIPYRDDGNNGLELKYALRSIEKYLDGYEEIYLIGDKPDWVKVVNHIPFSEPKRKSSQNILNKLWEAFKYMDRYIQWQDDIYLTRTLKVKDFKFWFDRTLSVQLERYHGGYKQLIINTALKATESFPYYDVHAPIIYRKEIFEKVMDWSWDKKNYIIKTAYCYELGECYGEQITDAKIGSPKKEITEHENLFFSTGPQGMCPKVVELLESLYPEKSNYEN